MNITQHAIVRSSQRGIPLELIDVIIELGTPLRRPGNAVEYLITKKEIEKATTYLKRLIQKIEHSCGKRVLVDSEKKVVITVYNKSGKRKNFRK